MGTSETGLGFPPPHPGEILKEDMLPQLGMTVGQFAEHLGVRRPAISAVLNQKADVSHDMAIRLGKAFQNGTRFWLALQMQYDIWNLERERVHQIEVAPLAIPPATMAS